MKRLFKTFGLSLACAIGVMIVAVPMLLCLAISPSAFEL